MWIVLELWPDLHNAMPVTHQDGATMVFREYRKAEAERANCQDGLIVPVGGSGRRRLEALTEIKRVYPDSTAFDTWNLADLERTCSDLRQIGDGLNRKEKINPMKGSA